MKSDSLSKSNLVEEKLSFTDQTKEIREFMVKV